MPTPSLPSHMIVLVHHGDAIGPEVEPTRPLSGPGRAASARLAAAAAARGVRPDVVWHSGKLRARQTAELFWHACNPLAAFSAARGLQPTDPPGRMREQLEEDSRSIVLVGHMPHLVRLLRVLCGELPDSVTTDFPMHGCVALECQGETWKELWRLEGEVLCFIITAAFGRRCIPSGVVAPPSNTPGILSCRASPDGRLATLDASP